MKEFECKGCGASLYLEDDVKKEPKCTNCRETMRETGGEVDKSKLKKFTCKSCGKEFYLEKGKTPYKCPFCNYTFPITPGLKQEERL